MPYELRKQDGGYKVGKQGSSKTFSKKPMSKEKAKAQLAALHINAPKESTMKTKEQTLREYIRREIKKALTEEEKAKPDYLDFDKDGNEKEPMKKALKDKEKEKLNELDANIEAARKKYLAKIDAAGKAIGALYKDEGLFALDKGAKDLYDEFEEIALNKAFMDAYGKLYKYVKGDNPPQLGGIKKAQPSSSTPPTPSKGTPPPTTGTPPPSPTKKGPPVAGR